MMMFLMMYGGVLAPQYTDTDLNTIRIRGGGGGGGDKNRVTVANHTPCAKFP